MLKTKILLNVLLNSNICSFAFLVCTNLLNNSGAVMIAFDTAARFRM